MQARNCKERARRLAELRRNLIMVVVAGCGFLALPGFVEQAVAQGMGFSFGGERGGISMGGSGGGFDMRRGSSRYGGRSAAGRYSPFGRYGMQGGRYGMQGGRYGMQGGRYGMQGGRYGMQGGRYGMQGGRYGTWGGRYGASSTSEGGGSRWGGKPIWGHPVTGGCYYRNCGGGGGEGGYPPRWPRRPLPYPWHPYPWRPYPPPVVEVPPNSGPAEPSPERPPPRHPIKPVYTPPPEPAEPPPKRVVKKPAPTPTPERLVKKVEPKPPVPKPPALPERFVVPPSTEARYVKDEVLVEIPAGLSARTLQRIERRLGLTLIASRDFSLLDAKVNRYRIAKPRTVAGTVEILRTEGMVASAQPNYVFALQDGDGGLTGILVPPPLPVSLTPPPLPGALTPPPLPKAEAPTPPAAPVAVPSQPAASPGAAPPSDPGALQYIISAMHLLEAHRLATGKGVRIAIIDSGIDIDSAELSGRIIARFDAVGGSFEAHSHGTAIAGAILAHAKLMGVAPDADVIAIRAFTGEGKADGAEGTSYQILEGLEFAAAQEARIVNMSFAGAHDAMLARSLRKLRAKGVAEIAAAGNGGAKSDPLYPGAEPGVIAVTATDEKGQIFVMANRGSYIAVAAPGVDILLPAPGDAVQIASGTSIAAAEVSGIAALALQRYGVLTPDALIGALDAGARKPDPGASSDDYGAGVIDALGVVEPKAGAAAGRRAPVASAAQR
jgi:hypothetical protein